MLFRTTAFKGYMAYTAFTAITTFTALATFTAFATFLIPSTQAATLPSGFTETKLIGNVNPTCVEVIPDGRVLLCEKPGRILVYKNGEWLKEPLLTVDADFQQERGLLGLALDPDFKNTPFVYIYYTAKNPAHNRVSRFRVEGDLAAKEEILLEMNPLGALPTGGWHNGGSIRFGKDGKLYIATGNNVISYAGQGMGNLLGKLLRINSDGTIPTDNPYYQTATGDNRAIWAIGLRNPYTTDIHPVTGRFLVNDVGEGAKEEIDEGLAGRNYGYPNVEGKPATPPTGLTGTYADPISEYNHGEGCAIAGAAFYHPRDNTFGPDYADAFFFADYCKGFIRYLPGGGGEAKPFATGIVRPIYLHTAGDGSLYYVARGARIGNTTVGSPEDNAATEDGSLFRIQGPVPVRLGAPKPRWNPLPVRGRGFDVLGIPGFPDGAGRIRFPAPR